MGKTDQQLKDNDCGISAIKTVYNLLGREIDRNYIKDQIFLDEKGSALNDIKRFFDSNGCKTSLKFLDVSLNGNGVKSLKKLFPFILPVNRGNRQHYVVINGLRKNKLKVYDPANHNAYFLSFAELRAIAHYTQSNWDLVDFDDRIRTICQSELNKYDMSFDRLAEMQDTTRIFNKLAYFTYVRDNFGFKNSKSEKLYLDDILYNQDIQVVPEQFRQLKMENGGIRLSAPVVLLIKTLPLKSPKSEQEQEKTNIYAKLLKELGPHKRLWYIYLFAAIFAASLTQLTVFISQLLIDHVLPSFQINILTIFAIGFALFRVFSLLINLYKYFTSIHVSNILDKYFLVSFNDKFNKLPLKHAQTYKRGDLSERLSDAMKLKSFFLSIFSHILVDTFVSIYSLAILFYINWRLTLLVCLVMLIYFFWFMLVTPHLRANEKKRFVMKSDFISGMLEKIDGMQVIKCFRTEGVFSNQILRRISELIRIQTKTRYIGLINMGVVSLISTVAYTLIVIFLARDFIYNQTLSFGQLITFIMLSERIFSTLGRILEENLALQENEVILRRYFDFYEGPEEPSQEGIKDFSIQRMTLKNLSFGYHPSSPVLKDLDFYFNQGEKIKIEGSNGSGKSSLSKILSFLYPHNSGDIIINETKSHLFDRESLKSKVLLVSNEDTLFNESLLFNITFGKDIPHAKVISLARMIGFYDFIASHEEGLQYIISENGKNLSTGQRKKILILRALLSQAEVIIFDEVLSGIDAESRERIEKLINEIDHKTFIVISHEAVKNLMFDRNFVLNNGELAHV